MTPDEILVGRNYLMRDARTLRVEGRRNTEDAHIRIVFSVIDGEPTGYLDLSLKEFAAQAVREIPSYSTSGA
jgi:hypothetical protein